MTKIRLAVVSACVAVAVRIKRCEIPLVLGIFDVDSSPGCHGHAVSGNPRRQNAVKHVNSPLHTLKEAVGTSHSHEVPRLVLWKQFHALVHYIVHDILRFTNRESPYGVSRQIHFRYCHGAFPSQILVHSPLHNSEKGLIQPFPENLGFSPKGVCLCIVIIPAPGKPSVGSVHGLLNVAPVCRIRGALVKGHHYV